MERDHRRVSAVRLAPQRLDLPIFLLSRNRIKQHFLEPTRNYISRNRLNYTSHCDEEKHTKTNSIRKLKEKLGYDHAPSPPCPQPRLLRIDRSLVEDKPWQLPPNRYSVHQVRKIPKKTRKSKRHTCNKDWPPKEKPKDILQNLIKAAPKELVRESCSHHKGEFLGNARDYRATNRMVITDPAGCYRDPSEPGPNYYDVQNSFVKKFRPTDILNQKPKPHIFLPHSSVPAKSNACHPKNISFAPGPGRYEKFYGFRCHCRSRSIIMPELQLLIEREKRNKFRRLPYTKIKVRNYCSTELSHIVGHGFRHLFKRQSQMKPRDSELPQTENTPTKSQKTYRLYPEARYIGMINEPRRQEISLRLEKSTRRPARVNLNCLGRNMEHRFPKGHKIKSFNSTAVRFKDIPRAPILTVSQQERIKSTLPLDRQLHNHPVTRVQLTDIRPKLFDSPKNTMECVKKGLRKTAFQFNPLPPPRILGHYKDIRPEKPKPLFDYEMDPKVFFKDNLNENLQTESNSNCENINIVTTIM